MKFGKKVLAAPSARAATYLAASLFFIAGCKTIDIAKRAEPPAPQCKPEVVFSNEVPTALQIHLPNSIHGFSADWQDASKDAIYEISKAMLMQDSCDIQARIFMLKNAWRKMNFDEIRAGFEKAKELEPANADVRFQCGYYFGSISEFTAAISLNPNYVDAYLARAGELARRDSAAAISDYAKVMELCPEQAADMHAMIGNVYAEKRNYAKAYEYYTKAIELGTKIGWIYREAAYAAQDLGKLSEAMVLFKKSMENGSKDEEEHKALADLLFDSGKFGEAAAMYGRYAALLDSGKSCEKYKIGQALVRIGEATERQKLAYAENYYRQAIDIYGDWGAAYALGRLHYAKGEHLEAIIQYRLAQERGGYSSGQQPYYDGTHVPRYGTNTYPGAAEHYATLAAKGENAQENLQKLGKVRFYEGRHSAAVEALGKALKLSPNDAEALKFRAMAHAYLKQQKKAIADCSRLISNGKEVGWALKLRASMYAKIGAYGKAAADYTELMRIGYRGEELFIERGKMLSRQGKRKNAIEDFSRAIQLGSEEIARRKAKAREELHCYHGGESTEGQEVAYVLRGLEYQKLGNYPRAIVDFDSTINKYYSFSYGMKAYSALLMKGETLELMGKPDEALKCYEDCLRSLPGGSAYLNAARILDAKGEHKKAESYRKWGSGSAGFGRHILEPDVLARIYAY